MTPRSSTAASLRLEVIDIGSVSVRMGIADIKNDAITTFTKKTAICDLGRDLDKTGNLDPLAMQRVLSTVDNYLGCFVRNHCNGVVCTLTQAAREAGNAPVLLQALSERGLAPQIIDGEVEGLLTALGAASACNLEGPLVVADSGGGSTELCAFWAHTALSQSEAAFTPGWIVSTPLGCRRVAERFLHAEDPPSAVALSTAKSWCEETLHAMLPTEPWAFATSDPLSQEVSGAPNTFAKGASNKPTLTPHLVVTGGTATTLAALKLKLEVYDPLLVQNIPLSISELNSWYEQLCALPLAERANLPSMDPKRAPVIVSGTIILRALIEVLGLSQLTVSDADGLQGIALAAARALHNGTPLGGWLPHVVRSLPS